VWDWSDKNGMYLEAARGWLELGDARTATQELENISGLRRAQPDVLRVRLQIAMEARDWRSAFALAQGLIRVTQHDAEIFLWRSEALRHLPEGGVHKALALLLEATNDFPNEAAMPFQLACYNCQLGEEATAQCWLALAFEAAQRQGCLKKWKAAALENHDLAPLRKKMGRAVSLWM